MCSHLHLPNIFAMTFQLTLIIFYRSPVKTNPFAECDKPRRVAKLHALTPMYGPALPAKSSRVLTGKDLSRSSL